MAVPARPWWRADIEGPKNGAPLYIYIYRGRCHTPHFGGLWRLRLSACAGAFPPVWRVRTSCTQRALPVVGRGHVPARGGLVVVQGSEPADPSPPRGTRLVSKPSTSGYRFAVNPLARFDPGRTQPAERTMGARGFPTWGGVVEKNGQCDDAVPAAAWVPPEWATGAGAPSGCPTGWIRPLRPVAGEAPPPRNRRARRWSVSPGRSGCLRAG